MRGIMVAYFVPSLLLLLSGPHSPFIAYHSSLVFFCIVLTVVTILNDPLLFNFIQIFPLSIISYVTTLPFGIIFFLYRELLSLSVSLLVVNAWFCLKAFFKILP